MSDDEVQKLEEAVEEVVAEPEVEESVEPEADPRELEAREQGWVPKEEWKGPPEKWRDLDAFLDVGERIKRTHKDLRKDLKAQEKQNAELRKAVEQLVQGQEAIRKAEREKTIKELKAQRREAVADGDVIKVEQLDAEIEKEAKDPPRQEQKGPDPVVQSWIGENEWFGPHNPEAQAFAQAIDAANAQRGIPVDKSLEMVSKEVKKRFPELFDDYVEPVKPARRAPAVEGAGKSRPGKSSSLSDLPEVVQKIAKDFEAQGIMSVKDYIKLYNSQGGAA